MSVCLSYPRFPANSPGGGCPQSRRETWWGVCVGGGWGAVGDKERQAGAEDPAERPGDVPLEARAVP